MFDLAYYQKQSQPFTNMEEAIGHYGTTGSKAGLSPSPFMNPAILKRLYQDMVPENLLFVEFGYKSAAPLLFGPLFNLNYFCWKHNCASEDAIYLFLNRLQDGVWCDFSPLVCEDDFLRSGSTSLYHWVAGLFDPDRSLMDLSLTFFLPAFYRRTSTGLTYENELIDYLLLVNFTGGWPHPLCDLRFAAIYGSLPTPPYEFGDAWSDALAHWPDSAPLMSPFFDAADYHHRVNPVNASEALALPTPAAESINETVADDPEAMETDPLLPPHPLIVFSHAPITDELSVQCLQNCLKYASGKYPVTALDKPILGRELIDIIADYLTSASPAAAEIKTSVCILHYNKLAHTYFSAVSAALNSDEHTEIIVFDNGSDSWQAEALLHLFKKHRKIRFIRSKTNLYFGEGNNVAKDMARGQYLYFLNNDAYVGPGTIAAVVAHLDSAPEAAACGVPFLFPDGTLQEYGGAITGSGQQIQDYKHTPLKDHMQNAPRQGIVQTQYISSASFCVRRSVLEDVGGYDYIYEPLYFEDTDLCQRICAAGYKIDLLYDHYVIHVENATTREFLGGGFMSQIDRNRNTFRRRWQYTPKSYKPRSVAAYMPAFTNHYPQRPNAVIYTPYAISIGGGERYILSIVAALSRTHNVTLCGERMVSRDRIAFVMADLGITLAPDSSLRLATADALYTASAPDLMIVMGNALVPPVKMSGAKNIYHCQFPFPAHYQDYYQFERIDNIDAYMCNSRFTLKNVEQKLADIGKSTPVRVLFPPVAVQASPKKDFSTIATAPSIISVGRFERGGHAKNQHVTAQVFREVQKTIPGAGLTLVGGFNGSAAQAAYVKMIQDISSDVRIEMNASRPVLETQLTQAHLYIHACGYEASLTAVPERQEHFGISVVEAMAHGCIPIVYDAGGAKEIVEEAGCGFTYRTIAEAAAIVRRLCRLPVEELDALSARAVVAAAQYSDENFAENLTALL
ncbi:glycosyltransferase [Asticcacaulis sp. EMRT-3]|uniref:glycosyltransferase n=1 Tax=Asticcacaulis sp. EMRT-3 TaxID=3040349 RepID=UPI0024AEFF62|nr:glycosyltransferase [Asticcacaulis sp. EMRT-3]MDI7776350.1 glycosyltransferase [Asticcacaulis sp. EMRT-3]